MDSETTTENRIITLPVNPAVKKFIICNFGQEPLKCTQQNILGKQLRAVIVQDSKAKREPTPPNFAEISLNLSRELYKHRERFEFFAVREKLFHDLFIVALKFFVNGQNHVLHSRKLCILKFFELHGIIAEKDMKVESAERMFHYRKHIAMNIVKARPDELERKRWQRLSKMIENCHILQEENEMYRQQITKMREEIEKEREAMQLVLNCVKKQVV